MVSTSQVESYRCYLVLLRPSLPKSLSQCHQAIEAALQLMAARVDEIHDAPFGIDTGSFYVQLVISGKNIHYSKLEAALGSLGKTVMNLELLKSPEH